MNVKLFDLHTDLPTANFIEDKIAIALTKKKEGVFAINAVYRGEKTLEEALFIAQQFYKEGLSIAFEDACYYQQLMNNGAVDNRLVESLAISLCNFNPLYISLPG